MRLKSYGLRKEIHDDIRTVNTADFLTSSNTTGTYITDISNLKVENQKQQNSCTAQSLSKALEYKLKDKRISARWLYNLTDNMFYGNLNKGVSALYTCKAMQNMGNVEDIVCEDDNSLPYSQYKQIPLDTKTLKLAKELKINGYAQVPTDPNEIEKALRKYGVIVIAVYGSKYYSNGRIKPGNYNHAMLVYGIEDSDKILVLNSWGKKWGDNGKGYLSLKEFRNKTVRFWAIGDIPQKEIQKAKNKWAYKYFAPYEVKGLNAKLISKLDEARGIAGIPFIITSGYRSAQKNKLIGGVDSSAHTKGLAVDMKARSASDKYKIVMALIKVGITRIGIYDKHIHCDIDSTKPNSVIWIGKSH